MERITVLLIKLIAAAGAYLWLIDTNPVHALALATAILNS